MSNAMNEQWFKLLTLLDQTNHLIKEGDWYMEDKMEFYDLKDEFLSTIIKNKPEELSVDIYYIPYYKYSKETKDKAGDLMRQDEKWMPFEHYLSLVELSSDDAEITDKANIEVLISYQDRVYSFHVPLNKTLEWDIDMDELPRKAWLSDRESNREQFNKVKVELTDLMEEVIGESL